MQNIIDGSKIPKYASDDNLVLSFFMLPTRLQNLQLHKWEHHRYVKTLQCSWKNIWNQLFRQTCGIYWETVSYILYFLIVSIHAFWVYKQWNQWNEITRTGSSYKFFKFYSYYFGIYNTLKRILIRKIVLRYIQK